MNDCSQDQGQLMRIPSGTYRIQFNSSFTFRNAEEIVDYLFELGISDLYASPIFKARKGSRHGYDVTDPNQINPDLGGEEAFERLNKKLRSKDMGWLQDIVPSHMAYDPDNWMLMDVLEKGKDSSFFDFFDISWNAALEEVKGKLLAPFLGKPYLEALKSGEIKLARSERGITVNYYDWRLPLKTGSLEKIGKDLDEINRDHRALDGLLSEQLYKLAYWKSASEESNYRSFLNISGLISLKPEAFEKTHELIFKLVKEGKFTGLRIDHIDGLFDPADYLSRLKPKAVDAYLIIEKILTGKEALPKEWPVEGTTGYDFLNQLNGIFCDTSSAGKFDKLYSDFTGIRTNYDDLLYERKKMVVQKYMAAKVNYLAQLAKHFQELRETAGQLTLAEFKRIILEVMASYPVYRTYISEKSLSKVDLHYLNSAIESAKGRNPDLFERFDSFKSMVQLLIYFLMRLQQYTGPIMAKGFEDTLLYCYNRLLSLNEVGGSPDKFGTTLSDFHLFCRQRDLSLNATATHDTKRGEDVRARINVLSELPDEWSKLLNKLAGGFEDRNTEYFLYQTLLGAWPFEPFDKIEFAERIKQYMLKSAREAKTHTSWLEENGGYEQALLLFVEKILLNEKFLESFLPFQKKIAFFGVFNSLSQTLIKICAPGIPDFYQGTELWDLNLVDPDNRRPVDYKKRKALLKEIRDKDAQELLSGKEDGRIKMFLIYKLLNAKISGEYIPLVVEGRFKNNIIAFVRGKVIAVAPRFLTSVVKEGELPLGEKVWQDTRVILPGGFSGAYNDAIVGDEVAGKGFLSVGKILKRFPAALLCPKE